MCQIDEICVEVFFFFFLIIIELWDKSMSDLLKMIYLFGGDLSFYFIFVVFRDLSVDISNTFY